MVLVLIQCSTLGIRDTNYTWEHYIAAINLIDNISEVTINIRLATAFFVALALIANECAHNLDVGISLGLLASPMIADTVCNHCRDATDKEPYEEAFGFVKQYKQQDQCAEYSNNNEPFVVYGYIWDGCK
jgi:hypothetical protein